MAMFPLGFQSQSGQSYSHLAESYVLHVTLRFYDVNHQFSSMKLTPERQSREIDVFYFINNNYKHPYCVTQGQRLLNRSVFVDSNEFNVRTE